MTGGRARIIAGGATTARHSRARKDQATAGGRKQHQKRDAQEAQSHGGANGERRATAD